MVASLVVVTFPLEPMPTHVCVARVVEMCMWWDCLGLTLDQALTVVATTPPPHNVTIKLLGLRNPFRGSKMTLLFTPTCRLT